MQETQFYIAATLFVFTMFVTPGPNNAVAMAVGLSHSFRSTIPHIIAVGVGGPFMLCSVALGLGFLFVSFPFLVDILKVVGSLYILWLASKVAGFDLKLFKRKQKEISKKEPKELKPLTFFQGFLFQLVNVKGWLTSVVTYTAYVAPGDILPRMIYLNIVLLIFGIITPAMWAAGGVFMRRFLSSEGIKTVNYVLAGFLVLSVALIFI